MINMLIKPTKVLSEFLIWYYQFKLYFILALYNTPKSKIIDNYLSYRGRELFAWTLIRKLKDGIHH